MLAGHSQADGAGAEERPPPASARTGPVPRLEGADLETGAKAPKAKGTCYSNLPGTTMMAPAGDDLFPFDDNWRGVFTRRAHPTTFQLTRGKVYQRRDYRTFDV